MYPARQGLAHSGPGEPALGTPQRRGSGTRTTPSVPGAAPSPQLPANQDDADLSGRNAIKSEAIFKRQLENKYIHLERINRILNESGAKEEITMEIECLQLNINKNTTSIFKCSTFN